MKNSIILPTDQIKTLLETGELTKRIPIKQVPQYYHGQHFSGDKKGQPKHIMEWELSDVYEENGCFYLDVQTDVDDNTHESIKPPYTAGQEVYVREVWEYWGFDGQEKVYVYKADDEDCFYNSVWHSPATMPREAARLFPTVADVRVEQDDIWYWEIKFELKKEV